MSERLTYTIEEAAELLGVSRGLAYGAASRDEIPTVKIGRRLLVPRRALLELLGENGTGGPGDEGDGRHPATPR